MQAIKKLNNNFAFCVDSNGNELIAYGKGVGFGKFPCELDLKSIDSTFYNINPQLISLISQMPEDIFLVSRDIVQYAQRVSRKPIPNYFVFSLSDHIQFAVERQNKHIHVKMPFSYEIEHLYETEFQIGKYALKVIQRKLHVRLPKEEATGIALHFINNYQQYSADNDAEEFEEIFNQIIRIIEDEMNFELDRGSYDCYRFGVHLKYFIKRADDQNLYHGDGAHLIYEQIKQEYPETDRCTRKVLEYLEQKLTIECTEEEQLYLMIYINRVCINEGCHH